MSEMLADMLDHAAASKVVVLEDEGWDDYAREMYANSPVFRDFLNQSVDWYPSVEKWIDVRKEKRD
ncbi:MAG: hypothetical protein NPIRA03_31750 [Nitrospirales bacterium]|nr:MAG: hypothetical protein NPIRA03_31750 [Nitrospirales bacterium]